MQFVQTCESHQRRSELSEPSKNWVRNPTDPISKAQKRWFSGVQPWVNYGKILVNDG